MCVSLLQYIDAAGLGLFLKTYLEEDDFPDDLCQCLFRYFQRFEVESQNREGTSSDHGSP